MSGKRRDTPGPASFTQEEIDALAAGRRPTAISRRLSAAKPTAARPVRRSGPPKPAPPTLKRSELAALRKGRPSPAVRKRLFTDVERTAPPEEEAGEVKPYPSQPPPVGRMANGE